MLPTLETYADNRGFLSVIQDGSGLDFEVRRVYMVHEMLGSRGEHAHRHTNQIIICTSGIIEVAVTSPNGQFNKYNLKQYENYLRIYPLSWLSLTPKSDLSSYLVLADKIYEERDTIRCYEKYVKLCENTGLR